MKNTEILNNNLALKATNYKIKGDQLWAQIDNKWYLVTCSTFSLPNLSSENNCNLSLESIGLNQRKNKVEKGENGLKIRLSGRLKGVRMARKVEEHVGVGLRTQSIEWAIEEENRQIYTKWGTIGLKVSRGGAKER